jgi:acyl dehydratase
MTEHFPAPELSYEDLTIGRRLRTGTIEVTREEMLAFASRYDPQPFHLEETAGQGSVFGGMSASGWFTAALTMRLMILGEFKFRGGAVGLGVEAIRWSRPVHVGDRLTAETEVAAMRVSESRPAFGIVKFVTTTTNQRGEVVMTKTANVLIPRRNAPPRVG